MESYNEADLLMQLSEGNEAAFAKIMEQYRHRVFRVALRVLGSRSQAAEIMQEVFIAVWDNREKFADPSSNIGGYCYTVAKNNAVKAFKKRYSQSNVEREYVLSQPD